MGLVSSRLNFDALHSGRRRSQQDETLYSYSLNKSYFSNYFLMGGERFEVNDPDYLFGDNCDLNFLSCAKPYSLPYKQAQQNLLSNLNTKQKALSKRPNRVNRLSSPLNILTGRHGRNTQTDCRKQQDAQTQTSNSSKSSQNGISPSQPLVMFVNIRKETLRLVKSSNQYNLDSDLNSLTNSISISACGPQQPPASGVANYEDTELNHEITLTRSGSSSKHSRKSLPKTKNQQIQNQLNRHSAANSRAATATICQNEDPTQTIRSSEDDVSNKLEPTQSSKRFESDVSSLLSATSSTRSGYRSVKEEGLDPSVDERSCNSVDNDDDDEYDDFKDALNDTTNLSVKEDDDDDSEQTQQHRSLLGRKKESTKENRDIKITIEHPDGTSASNSSDIKTDPALESSEGDENLAKYSTPRASTRRLTKSHVETTDNNNSHRESLSSRVYNIEFYFDAVVDCSIRIFYFCTREITSNGINYKPQHATYKSKVYYYKKGLNQRFDQQEHTFQPYLFDEDLLIYKPLDLDGNYNSGAVFPIVIHCVALEGSTPMQSHSLVATIEKSQLDDSYSIKPLKQLIFVDGVQYILQDIYGIEHKQLSSATPTTHRNKAPKILKSNRANLRVKSQSVQSNLDTGSSLNLSDTASAASVDFNGSLGSRQHRSSTVSNQHKSLGSENTFECVICMSEERDTMLLPCRHLCLCSSCAQSLRYQASSCPICRSPFKAALNLRPVQRHSRFYKSSQIPSGARKSSMTSSNPIVSTSLTEAFQTNQDSSAI